MSKIVPQFHDLLALITKLGHVPESRLGMGTQRLDIVAQSIRMGVLLGIHAPHEAPESQALANLLHQLVLHVAPDGTIASQQFSAQPHSKACTAMLAEQALALAQLKSAARHLAEPGVVFLFIS